MKDLVTTVLELLSSIVPQQQEQQQQQQQQKVTNSLPVTLQPQQQQQVQMTTSVQVPIVTSSMGVPMVSDRGRVEEKREVSPTLPLFQIPTTQLQQQQQQQQRILSIKTEDMQPLQVLASIAQQEIKK